MPPESPADLESLRLAEDASFQTELAALRAKATLTDLLGVAPDYRWGFSPQRIVRNATALLVALKRQSIETVGVGRLGRSALIAAQAWEGIAAVEDVASRSAALMNASTLYELAGYQANSSCLARLAARPDSWSVDPTFEGLASAFIQRLLIRVITSAPAIGSLPRSLDELNDHEIATAMATALGASGLFEAARFLLSGDFRMLNNAVQALELANDGFAALGEVRKANLASNLLALLPVIEQKSTWNVLGDLVPGNRRWERYLRVLARGLGSRVLDSRSISELWPSQLAALKGGLLDHSSNKVVKLPTSAGKTRVAEMAIVHMLTTRPDSRCLYVAPFRALVSEVEESFANLFSDLGYSASTVPGSFDTDALDQVVLSDDQVLVLTPEKLDLVMRLSPEMLEGVALIVLDEGHLVGDSGRGAQYELLVARLRRRLPQAQLLMLSAVISAATLQDFAEWLNVDSDHVVESAWRPSIQRVAKLDWSSVSGTGVLRYSNDEPALARFLPNLVRKRSFEYVNPATGRTKRPVFPEANNKGHVAAALTYELAPLGPVLVFCAQTDWAQSVGNALELRIELGRNTGEPVPPIFQPANPPRSFLVAQEWLGDEDSTTRLLKQGIGVHHGRLPEAVRNAVEEDFRNRRLAVLAATTTLAQGVNLPVRSVVIHSVRRFDEESGLRIRIPARDYWNIAGRAGRAGEETEGTIIHIVTGSMDQADYDYYLRSRRDVEPVVSALYTLLSDLIAARISSEEAASKLDAELLALLAEESAGTIGQTDLRDLIVGSLVGVQARASLQPLDPLVEAMNEGRRSIAALVPDNERRKVFSTTGLRTDSCLSIASHIDGNRDALGPLISAGDYGDIAHLASFCMEGLASVPEMQPRAAYGGLESDLLAAGLKAIRFQKRWRMLMRGKTSASLSRNISLIFCRGACLPT